MSFASDGDVIEDVGDHDRQRMRVSFVEGGRRLM